MKTSTRINDLLETINDHTHNQANPAHLIELFEERFSPLDQAPEPVRKFYDTYLNKQNPSTSLTKSGMLLYLPQLKKELENPAYRN